MADSTKQLMFWIIGALFTVVMALTGAAWSSLDTTVNEIQVEQKQLRNDLTAGVFSDSLSTLKRISLEARMEKCESEITALKLQSP